MEHNNINNNQKRPAPEAPEDSSDDEEEFSRIVKKARENKSILSPATWTSPTTPLIRRSPVSNRRTPRSQSPNRRTPRSQSPNTNVTRRSPRFSSPTTTNITHHKNKKPTNSSSDTDKSDDYNYIVDPYNDTEIRNNAYVKECLKSCDLHVHREEYVIKSWEKEGPQGLFHQFINKTFITEYIRNLTQDNLKKKALRGKKSIDREEMLGAVGIELAMSLVGTPTISGSFDTSKRFHGHPDLGKVMSFRRFQNIRGSMKFQPPADRTGSNKDKNYSEYDPLHDARPIMNHFFRNCSIVAVPVGCVALDENSCATKGRSLAKRNKTGVDPGQRYVKLHPELKYAWAHTFFHTDKSDKDKVLNATGGTVIKRNKTKNVAGPKNTTFVKKDSSGALWAMQIAHLEKKLPMIHSKVKCKLRVRRAFMDNYYTRHFLAQQVVKVAQSNVNANSTVTNLLNEETHDTTNNMLHPRMIGTCRINYIDDVNQYHIQRALQQFKDAKRGDWCLVPAFDTHPDHDKQKAACRRDNSKSLVPDFSLQSQNSGYIILQDTKVCVFYTNDLHDMPLNEPVFSFHNKSSKDELDHAIKCVHGLGPMFRWTNENMLNRDVFMVPSPIVAYNLFMNSVDIMDQLRATCATKRRERRIDMSLYTFILDLAVNNAFSLYKWLWDNKKMLRKKYKLKLMEKHNQIHTLREFKRQIAEGLCGGLNKKEETITTANFTTSTNDHHTIVKMQTRDNTKKRGQRDCKLCSLGETRLGRNGRKLRHTCCYECSICQSGFHIECFIVYHNIDNYPDVKRKLGDKKVVELKRKLANNDKCNNARASKYGSNSALILPFMKDQI